jgi:hypothetical protein
MTIIGAGGMVVRSWKKMKRFHKDYDRLSIELRDRVDITLQDLVKSPIPAGLRFEKLKGWHNPDIYTVHVTGNHKISFEVSGTHASLRRVAPHDEIDHAP